jgi:Domain of unknown function (DUF4397)
MRAFKIGLALAGTIALAACGRDASSVFTADNGPLAAIRFVNAVSDSGAQDWRFVDVIENSPVAFGLAFRGMFPGAGYQAVGAGARHLRIFQTSTDIIQTQKVFFDTTFTFTQGAHYTLITAGTMRDRTAKLYIITDNFTDPGAQVSLRVFNAGAGPLDLYASAAGGTSALPSALASGLANFAATNYTPMAVGPVSLRGFLAGTSAFPAMVDVAAPAGLPADRVNDLTAVGGTTIAGSALTAFVFPRSVAGSNAANFTTAGVVYIVDKYPPSGF